MVAPHTPHDGCCSEHSPSDYGSNAGDTKQRVEGEDQSWEDWAVEATPCLSLFGPEVYDDAEVCLASDKRLHGVDLVLLVGTLGALIFFAQLPARLLTHRLADFFERVRLINWIRATVSRALAFERSSLSRRNRSPRR